MYFRLKIEDFTNQGNMTLEFSERMFDYADGYNITMLKDGGLNLSLILTPDTKQLINEIELNQNISFE